MIIIYIVALEMPVHNLEELICGCSFVAESRNECSSDATIAIIMLFKWAVPIYYSRAIPIILSFILVFISSLLFLKLFRNNPLMPIDNRRVSNCTIIAAATVRHSPFIIYSWL